ncbi:MAG: TIGR02680 family protein [Planctomycetales bacterium]|nr:TIGR02680 family protein [Planctomycetales bacterium]
MNSRDVTSDALETSVHTALAQAAERIIAGELPIPVRERWQPLRMGLMNLFLFEDERFPFADGRLLLRGTNGTGKSRVLAMTLPLLLDGSLKPNRVEPDRDSTRQVAWNLLMDDQNSRTGYSWLEFGRIDGQESVEGNGSLAEAQYLTIGCGMKAVRGQPIKPWFFVTDLRVNESLDLKSADGVPLTLRQLTESLADRGQVVETARDYRRLVDERLFRLGERYDPLIDLLLQLRQPQLAKKLDLEQLESALRSALPPLPESLLDDAAEAFRDLDQYRASLAADRQTLEDVTKFLRPYRDHVQRGTLRAAKRLTRANSEYEKAQRELRQASERLELNRRELQTEETRQRELRVRLAATEAALDALKSRPEVQDAERLDQLQQSIERQRKELAETEQDRQRSADELKTANDRCEQAASELKRHQDAAAESSANATATAAPDALVNRHRELTNPFLANGLADVKKVSSAQSKLTENIRHWRKATEHLASRNGEVATAQGKLRDASKDTNKAKQQMDQCVELLADAEAAENAERERLWDAIVKWYQTESPLQSHLPTLGPFSDDWHRWAETLFASDPLDAVITLAEQQTERRFAQEESVLVQQFEQHELCDALLASEQRQLESGASIEPPAPYTRDDAFREQQTTGAPLWQLIDFVSDVPASERPNWEAALESSGLLDAWLSADGTLSDANGQDTQLAIADEPALPLERQLRRVLRVTENCTQHGVSASIVDALLTVIGVGEGAGRIWVDRDGRWQNGPLHGCWTKPLAQFVGDDARTQWRAVRLAEIVVEREHIQIEMTRANARIEEINGLRIQVVEHRTRVPSTTALFQRHADTNAKQTQLDQASQRHRDCETVEQEHRDRVTSLIQRRDQDAADLGLTGWVEKLDELRQRLGDYESKLQVFWAMLESLASAYIRLDEAGQRLDNASKQQQMLQRRRDDKQIELTKDEVKYRELNAATGQAVAEIMRRLESQRAAKKTLDNDVEGCNQQIIAHHTAIGALESKLQQFEEMSQKSDEVRHEAADWFSTIGSHGLIDFAVD